MWSGRIHFGVWLLILHLTGAAALYAQLNRGVVEGIVSDPSGAVVPGVKLVLRSVDTNVSTNVTTNSAGYYRVADLVPGNYTAHLEATGFAPLDITQIEVLAGEVRRVDARLSLGTTQQEVRVTAEVPLVETSASNFSTTLGTGTIQDVPLAGRDLQQLVNLLPGVNNSAGPPGTLFGFNSAYGSFPDSTHAQGSDLSVNGGQGGANAWYLDGNLDLSGIGENMAVDPSPDAVSEFQAITNSFSAEYGRTGGAIFNVVLKSGTNDLHGNLYEVLQNSATNARNPFTSIDALGHIIPQSQLRYNDFGGTFGGPVHIPHLYNGKDRTFFFFSWDASILHLTGNQRFTVPTPLMRQGDFSEDPNVTTFGIWNPYSTVGPDPTTGLFQRTAFGTPVPGNPFGANGCLNSSVEAGPGATCNFSTKIPAEMLNPTAMFYMQSFPAPNFLDPLSTCPLASGGTFRICSNYLGSVGTSQDSQNISLKVDHRWSDKSTLFGEFLFNPGTYNNFRVPWKGPTFPQDLVGFGSQYPYSFANTIVALGNTYTISPTLINDFRLSFGRQYLNTHPSHPYPESVTGQSAAQQQLAPLNIPENKYFPVPHWGMSSPGSGGSFLINFGPTEWTNMVTGAQAYTLLDNLTKVMGRHTLKTGFMYRRETTFYQSGFPTGFSFSGQLVQDPSTGNGATGLAQFMLGATSNFNRDSFAGVMWSPTQHFSYWGFYGQDDFRVTPRFTLNLGLRYDIFQPFRTLQTPLSNFCLRCPNSTTGLPGQLIYQGDSNWPGRGQNLGPSNKNDFGPRINFAWMPFADQRTVVRGGYDVFFSNAFAGINEPGQGAANAPGWNQEYDWNDSFYPNQCAPFSGQCVAFPLVQTSVNKASLSGLPSTFPAANKSPLLGNSLIQFFTPPDHDPMVQTWNLEVQRELPANMMASIGYVGSHGTHLLGEEFRQFNFIPFSVLRQYKTGINANVPITQIYSGQTAAELQSVYGSATLPLTILLKPYPFYGAVAALQNNTSFDGANIYHALQIKLQKRPTHGLNFVVAYTFAKNIVNASTAQLASGLVDPIHFARAGNLGGRAGAVGGLSNGVSAAVFGGAFQDPNNRKADRAIAADDIPQILNIAAAYELPFGVGKPLLNRAGIVNGIFGGWQLSPNFNAESGLPLAINCPANQLTFRCDLIGNPHFTGNRGKAQRIAQWMNPAAFQPAFGSDPAFAANYDPNDPRAYLLATDGPRLPQIRSPGFWNVDTSLSKQFHLTETRYFQFRWDLLNALNHQNLAIPNTNWCLPPLPNGNTDKIHQAGCAFGQITNIQNDPRSMQFALKFFW